MSEHLSSSVLRNLAQIQDMGKIDELNRAIQAIVEGKPFGKSSLDAKAVATFERVGFTEANFSETILYLGQLMKRHRNGGGWVPAVQSESDQSKPFVAETAYVGPWAKVYDNARVYGSARIFGSAKVFENAKVYDNAWVFDAAQVYGFAWVFGNARVFDNAQVYGYARIYANGWVKDGAVVYGEVRVATNGVVDGTRTLSSGNVVGK